MRIGHGRAFRLESGDGTPSIPVLKTWEQLEGRSYLIESVEYPAIQSQLSPPAGAPAGNEQAKVSRPAQKQTHLARNFPPAPTGKRNLKPMRLVSTPLVPKGLAMDYYISTTGSVTNMCFQTRWTYLISGPLTLYGSSNVLEGCSVLKFARGASLNVIDRLITDTDTYRPAVLTAYDDTTQGAVLGSSLSGYYASPAIIFNNASNAARLKNLRVCYATTAFRFVGGSGHEVRHAQIVNCGNLVQATNTDFALRDVLAWKITNVVVSSGSASVTGVLEHVTIDLATNLIATGMTATLRVTNSLLVGVGNTNGLTGDFNAVPSSPTGIFKTVGGGQHYLADSSSYRDAGTTNINATLAAELTKLTTYAPTILGNVTTNSTWSPTVSRDTNTPDLGAHYAPLDGYASAVTIASNVTVLATNGVAVGLDVSSTWGLLLTSGKLLSQGNALNYNRFVRAHMAQETGLGNPGTRAAFYDGNSPVANAELRFRFTEMSFLSEDGYFLYTGQKFSALEWTHCRIFNPSIMVDTAGTNALVWGATNDLWRGGVTQFGLNFNQTPTVAHWRNNLLLEFWLTYASKNSNSSVFDNLFDNSVGYDYGQGPTNTCNAWYHSTNTFTVAGPTNITLTNWSYQTGPLAAYYQAGDSPLINAGSRSAPDAGLYHFTTTTNQVKELTSVVDIGLHHVAVDATGQPSDLDGDGIPDYVENSSGSGQLNAALFETDWQTYTTITNTVLGLQLFTPLKAMP